MWTLPPAVEEALWTAARELLPAEALSSRVLAEAIHERTRRYTSDRQRLGAALAPVARARDLAARALFFTVADAAKVQVPLAELSSRGLLPSRAPLRVLDVGAGVGAMTLGLSAALSGRPLEVTAVDRDGEALRLFARAAAILDLPVQTVPGDLAGAALAGPYDLILAGAVLNELAEAERVPLVTRLLALLSSDGALLVLEPALRETTRALHTVRDAIIASGAAQIFAPCTRRSAPCPALASQGDWCHEDRPFAPPPRFAGLSRQTGLRTHGLKFSYLTLRKDDAPLVPSRPGALALRVVSDALDQKGTVERIVCGAEGRTPLRILKRERGAAVRTLARARRGDVLLCGDEPTEIEVIRFPMDVL